VPDERAHPIQKNYPMKTPAHSLFSVCLILGLPAFGQVQPSTPSSKLAGSGQVGGSVTNRTTGNGLEGAKVEVSGLGLSALVDKTGSYVLAGVPVGTHELTATYWGLDGANTRVTVAAGQRSVINFELTSSIYQLDAFKVSGEKEGNAAAITRQRNALSLKNVVAMDAYGNLPNLDATELALRLPGVTIGSAAEELTESLSVRGTGGSMTSVTVDGGLISNIGAQSRTTRITLYTGAAFESLEVIKGMTPDTGAESLGGTINLRTRSPLNMKEKRRLDYTVSVAHAPAFTQQTPLRESRRSHPLVNVGYQEKFRVFGSAEENLAVTLNAFYSENVYGFFNTQRDFQQSDSRPAYLWDYRTRDSFNNRQQRSLSSKFEYRWSAHSLLRFNVAMNNAEEPSRRQYQTRAFAGAATTVPNATTTGVVPGWTDRITTVRAVPTPAGATAASTPSAAIDLTSQLISRSQRLRHFDVAGEHKYDRFEWDWAGLWSRSRRRVLGNEAALASRIGGVPVIGPNGLAGSAANNIVGPAGQTGVGWILDRTQSDLFPRFVQNGGLDFTNPNNYRPTQNGLSTTAGDLLEHLVRNVRGNARYKLPVQSFTAYLKAGFDLREQTLGNWAPGRRRYSYLGRDALTTDPTFASLEKVKTGRNLPVWEASAFYKSGGPVNPALWSEDRYFFESSKYTGFNRTQETVRAGYLMTQGKIGSFGFLTGVRGEETATEASAFARARVPSTAAQQLADPKGSADRDYAGTYRTRDDSYTKYFPSAHVYRDLTPNLKARASWSTSFGRPAMTNALPTETVNETAQTLTVGNPGLLPQMAKTWDLNLEYYFEPSGSFTVAWFHKTVGDYIVTGREAGTVALGASNGFNGQYEGFKLLSTQNAGTAIIQGWEFSYLKHFRFLPGVLRGLTLNANYSIIDTHGDYGTPGAYLGTNQIVGFIPRTANLSLSWNYLRFGARVLYNYTAENIRSYSATQPSRSQYLMAREMVNLALSYRLRPNLTFQVDVANITNSPIQYYRGIPDQIEQTVLQGVKLNVGLQGRF
jgi:iron complex outermembrane recepter protein